jgi:hypothetical protein
VLNTWKRSAPGQAPAYRDVRQAADGRWLSPDQAGTTCSGSRAVEQGLCVQQRPQLLTETALTGFAALADRDLVPVRLRALDDTRAAARPSESRRAWRRRSAIRALAGS